MGKRPFYKRGHMQAYHARKDEEFRAIMAARKALRQEDEEDRNIRVMMEGINESVGHDVRRTG